MNISCKVPAGWKTEGSRILGPGVLIDVGPLVLPPEDELAWMAALLAAGAAAGDVAVETEARFETATGYPALAVRATIGDEARLLVVYRFEHERLALLARGRLSPELTGFLVSVAPRRTRPVALSQIFEATRPD
jgi:hypothetical protein